MILNYIWVQDYKGFQNQGFNFSTENVFDFDKKALNKKNNTNYIPNFFPIGIEEVTGIVGKNSSGKTNLLELIQYIIDGANTIINKPFLVIFKKEKEYQVFTYKLSDFSINFDATINLYEGRIPNINSIFFSNVFDGRKYNFSKRILDISTNSLLSNISNVFGNKNYKKTIQQQIRFLKSKQFKLLERVEKEINDNVITTLKPTKLTLTSPPWIKITQRGKRLEEKIFQETEKKINIREFIRTYRKKITANRSSKSAKYYTAFLVFIDFLFDPNFFVSYTNEQEKTFNIQLEPLINILLKITEFSRIDDIHLYLTTDFPPEIDSNFNFVEKAKFLKALNNYELTFEDKSSYKEDLGSYSNRRLQFSFKYNDEISSFITNYLDSVGNDSLAYDIDMIGLSSGLKAYLNLFSSFYSIKKRIKEKNIIICIDEGDLYFHPKWQTEFFYKLVNILPKLLNGNCQLILTTHSPFLISDLPKKNLLFLEKTNNSQLRVIRNDEIKGETFGGNIGELYLDAFFMDGGLISHFVASKIKELIKKIRTNKKDLTIADYILINEIGEDIIKLQLKELINDKN